MSTHRVAVLDALDRAGRCCARCESCMLHRPAGAAPLTPDELTFLAEFKTRNGSAEAGHVLIAQGSVRPRLLTLFSGWALRTKTIASGEEQVVEVLLPGALVGLSTLFLGASPYCVYAITDVTMCELDPARLAQLLRFKTLTHGLLLHQQIETRRIEARLASVGAADATSRVAYFFADLFVQLEQRHMTNGLSFRSPLTREHVARAVGTTRGHVSRVLRQLRRERLVLINNGTVTIPDPDRLRQVGNLENDVEIRTCL
jgi:CRP/FNR family transcriptional regulator, anaerobic regulatory protein